ncbi:unnamed protein product [Camellia sinensis]|uniref:Photosystem II 5 kDa protein n=1 Tax=Camellia sinensis TaxID=4442 RepID=A0A7J7HKR2_CAMSI|nr:hypothetical protein HYC85_010512 [Camellia sinensis]
MASVSMTSSFLGGATTTLSERSPATTIHRRVVITNGAKANNNINVGERVKISQKESNNNGGGRRDLMFAAAAAAVCSVAGVAMAEGLKRGTPEARKIYAPVCVTMPTARICHK